MNAKLRYMKLLFLTLCTFLSCKALFAKTITVSNNPNSPGQYKRLDSAILAASSGDILLVSGSATDYAVAAGGAITINKPLTLYGLGYSPRNDQALPTTISIVHITSAGSGTTLSGFAITTQLYEDPGTNNIVISRCNIAAMWNFSCYCNGISGNNYDIRQSIIGNIAINANTSGVMIQNNIITGSIGSQPSSGNTLITNNYFDAGIGLNGVYAGMYNATVNNNIFYYKSTSASAGYANATNCVFDNNIYFNTSNANPFGIGTNNNTGTGNINGNPDFVSIALVSLAVAQTDNFNLKTGSPGINAGTDGTNIGPQGGSLPIPYPYTGQPAIPLIQSMTISNSVIPPNGTLNINFKASSNN
jgi:hypothetical protein